MMALSLGYIFRYRVIGIDLIHGNHTAYHEWFVLLGIGPVVPSLSVYFCVNMHSALTSAPLTY